MTSHVTGQSLSASTIKSTFSGSRRTEKVLEQLRNDSEDISRALEFYLQERNEINQKAARALREYEVEIEEIGDVSDVDDDYDQAGDEEIGHASSSVDHNLRRHLGTSGTVGSGDYEGDYGEDFEDAFDGEQGSRSKDPCSSSGLPAVSYQRKGTPSLEVKEAIRNKLFSFLDDNRHAETELSNKIEEMKKSMNEESLSEEEFVRLQVRCSTIEDTLFSLQKENHSKLLEFIGDYRPTLSGKLWGNDPEYRKTMKELKKRIHSI